ncbi:MAG: hypothetical protein QXT45_03820 [Candidatus Bilamarchaeaceae archaeon]
MGGEKMSVLSFFRRFLPNEPAFENTDFREFEDSLHNFMMFYPKHWKFEKTTAIVEGAYNIIFDSSKSDTSLCISVDMRPPYAFTEKKFLAFAKREIEKPSAGIVTTAKRSRFKSYPAMTTTYTFLKGQTEMFGERIIFYTGDRIFSILFLCPLSQHDKLKKTFEYIKDSITIKPKKAILL